MIRQVIWLLLPMLITAQICNPFDCRWNEKCGPDGRCEPDDQRLKREDGTTTDCGLWTTSSGVGRCQSSSCTALKFPNSARAEFNTDAVPNGCTAAVECSNKGPGIHCYNLITTGAYKGAYCLQSGNSPNYKICGGCPKGEWGSWSGCEAGKKTRKCSDCAITETVDCCTTWGSWSSSADLDSGRCMKIRQCQTSGYTDLEETDVSTDCPACTTWSDWDCSAITGGVRKCSKPTASAGLVEVSATVCTTATCNNRSDKCPTGMKCVVANDVGTCTVVPIDDCETHKDCKHWDMYCYKTPGQTKGVCKACTIATNDLLGGARMDCCQESHICKDSSCVALGYKNSAQANTNVDELAAKGAVCPAVGACAEDKDTSKCYSKVECIDSTRKDCYGYGEYCLLDGNNKKNFKVCADGCTNNNWGPWGTCYADSSFAKSATTCDKDCGKIRRRSCLDGKDDEDSSSAKRNAVANPSKKKLRDLGIGDCCKPSCSIASPIVASPITEVGGTQTVTWTIDVLPSLSDAGTPVCSPSRSGSQAVVTYLGSGKFKATGLTQGDETFDCSVQMLDATLPNAICGVLVRVPSCVGTFSGLPSSPLVVSSVPHTYASKWSFSMAGSEVTGGCTGTNGVTLSTTDTCSATSPCPSITYNPTTFNGGATTVTCTALFYGSDVQCSFKQTVSLGTATPAMEINKVTCQKDGDDDDSNDLCGDGLTFIKGDDIYWKYTVTNIGDVELSNVVVTDNEMPLWSATIGTLAVDTSQTVKSAAAVAIAGGYTNIGTVNAEYNGKSIPTVTDSSSYFGANPAIAINKVTCGAQEGTCDGHANCSDSATVITGKDVTWKYIVTNPGNVPLSDVKVEDDKEGIIGSPCSGDVNNAGKLDPDETWVFIKSNKKAGVGQYNNNATAQGSYTPSDKVPRIRTDSDESDYFGLNPQIYITKVTNGDDDLCLFADAPLLWKYTVTRGGNVDLSGVTVVDDMEGTLTLTRGDTNGDNLLQADETWEYELTGNAVVFNNYTNVATVKSDTIEDTVGNFVTPEANDESSYLTGGSGSTTLIAGQFHPAGTVTAYFDGSSICVLYKLIPGVTLQVVHVWIGLMGVNTMTIDKNGNPAPGQFQIKQESLSTGSTYVCKSIADLGIESIMEGCITDMDLLITAHAGVTSETLTQFKGQTAWGQGPYWSGSNWAMYFPLKVNCRCLNVTCTEDVADVHWGKFGETCSQPCGGGFRTRYREVGYCPPFEDYEPCNTVPCEPCGTGSIAETSVAFKGVSGTAKFASVWDGTLVSVTVSNVPKAVKVQQVVVETFEANNPIASTTSVQDVITSRMSFKLFGFQVMPACQSGTLPTQTIVVKATVKYSTTKLTDSVTAIITQNDLYCWCGAAGKDVVAPASSAVEESDADAGGLASWVGWVVGTVVGMLFGAAVAGTVAWKMAAGKVSVADTQFHIDVYDPNHCSAPPVTCNDITPYMSPSRRTFSPHGPQPYSPVAE